MDDNSPNIDQALLQAYRHSNYRLLNTAISIKIGHLSPQLDDFLIDNNAYSWVFISAENPQSIRLTKEENQRRYQQLLEIAEKRNYRYWEGLGEAINGDWPAEQSLLLLDVPQTEAKALAKQFDQKAIVQGQLNCKSKLLIIGEEKDLKMNRITE